MISLDLSPIKFAVSSECYLHGALADYLRLKSARLRSAQRDQILHESPVACCLAVSRDFLRILPSWLILHIAALWLAIGIVRIGLIHGLRLFLPIIQCPLAGSTPAYGMKTYFFGEKNCFGLHLVSWSRNLLQIPVYIWVNQKRAKRVESWFGAKGAFRLSPESTTQTSVNLSEKPNGIALRNWLADLFNSYISPMSFIILTQTWRA